MGNYLEITCRLNPDEFFSRTRPVVIQKIKISFLNLFGVLG